jgi:hypothetical protein
MEHIEIICGMPEDHPMPFPTTAAQPEALTRYAPATADACDRLRRHALEVGGGIRSDHRLGADLAGHVRRVEDLARQTVGVGVAFALAGTGTGPPALRRPLRGLDDDEVAAVVAGVLGLPIRGAGVAPTTVDPDDVAALASTLTPQQLARLASAHPHLVGPVDGMPVESRFAANRVLIATAAAAAERSGDRDRAEDLRALLAPTRRILFVDPRGEGRAAEVFGDLATARAIGVVVPGMGNSLANFEAGTARKGRTIAAAAGEGTAVVAWLGYDSPLAEVVLDDDAVAGAEHLVRLLDGLPGDARRTVIGHSYGTVVAAAALQRGLEVDQVVVTGSPGMLEATAADLAGDVPIWAGRAPFDYVGWSQAFGRDPSDARFGATRFDTGDDVAGHSGYFDPGSESLANIARIVTGDLAAVTVLEPGPAEDLIHVADGIDARADRFVDAAQARLEPLAGAAPQPVGDLLELASRATDVAQRLTSPDLVGDIALDGWAYARDRADGLLGLLPG